LLHCRAFQNARGLAVDGGGIDGRGVSTLVPLLKRVATQAGSGSGHSSHGTANGGLHAARVAEDAATPALQGGAAGADVAIALCGALRALAANDDICKVCRLCRSRAQLLPGCTI
jgi:hypothetical protein